MSQIDLLKKVARALDRLQVPALLSGSLASSLQGEPRATHDIDLVIKLELDQVDGLLAEFPAEEYYWSRSAVEDAVRRKSMFNVLDTRGGDKIDFWMLTDHPFDQSRFARRQRVAIDGVSIAVSAPEDTILMKLRWARDSGGSQQQLRDARQVFEFQQERLDRAYLDHWATQLGVEQLLHEIRSGAGS